MNEINGYKLETTSFLIKVQYRQNTSWQGTVQWLGGNQTRHFRSCLELLMLIEEALVSDAAKDKIIEFQTWDGKESVS